MRAFVEAFLTAAGNEVDGGVMEITMVVTDIITETMIIVVEVMVNDHVVEGSGSAIATRGEDPEATVVER